LIIKIKNFDLEEAKQIFYSMLCFIDYNSTFYVREDFDDHIEYFRDS